MNARYTHTNEKSHTHTHTQTITMSSENILWKQQVSLNKCYKEATNSHHPELFFTEKSKVKNKREREVEERTRNKEDKV